MAEMLTTAEVAGRLGVSVWSVRRMCKDGRLPGAKEVNGARLIPTTSHPKLAEAKPKTVTAEQIAEKRAKKLAEAERRAGIVDAFERFAAPYEHARTLAMDLFCSQRGLRPRTLRRWMKRHRVEGVAGLIDRRGAEASGATISEEAWELFKSMYLTQQRLSVAICRRNVAYINRDENRGWTVPTAGTLYRLIERNIPRPVQVLQREGLAAYHAKCAPYIEIDPDSVEPGAVWIGDHHQFNCWIRYRGRWVRPWITAWQDMRSRAIVGREISAAPNQTTILIAARRAIEKHGPPEAAKIDNGRDYDSEMWTGATKKRRRALRAGYIDEPMVAGLYAMLGVTVSFAIPYHPQSKAIERFFDTLDRQFTATLETYCGKDADRKPEGLNDLLASDKAIREAYDLEGFAAVAGRYIEAYNASSHSGAGMEGLSPAEVLASRGSQRVLGDGVLDLLMRVWSGELKVGKNGVRFRGMHYGQYDGELLMRQGKKVRVAYDPDDMRSIYIYDAATLRLITIAEQNRLIGYGAAVAEEELRNAMRQKTRALRIAREYVDTRLAANMDLTSLTIRAMEEAAESRRAEIAGRETEMAKTIKPVRTPMDGQVREHERQRTIKLLKKAAGAESMTESLDMDFSLLAKPKGEDLEFEWPWE